VRNRRFRPQSRGMLSGPLTPVNGFVRQKSGLQATTERRRTAPARLRERGTRGMRYGAMRKQLNLLFLPARVRDPTRARGKGAVPPCRAHRCPGHPRAGPRPLTYFCLPTGTPGRPRAQEKSQAARLLTKVSVRPSAREERPEFNMIASADPRARPRARNDPATC
jgi:hypothetical protein